MTQIQRIIIFSLLILVSQTALAQRDKHAVFEDKDGKSSILFPSSYIGINSSKESMEARMFYYPQGDFTTKPKYDTLSKKCFSAWVMDTVLLAEKPKSYKLDTAYINQSKMVSMSRYNVTKSGKNRYWYDTLVFDQGQVRYSKIVTSVRKLTITTNEYITEELYHRGKLVDVTYKETSSKKEILYLPNTQLPSDTKGVKKPLKVDSVKVGQYKRKKYVQAIVDSVYSFDPKAKVEAYSKSQRSAQKCQVVTRYHHARNKFYSGVTFSGSASNGISTLFNEDKFVIGTSLDLHVGMKNVFFSQLDKNYRSDATGKNKIRQLKLKKTSGNQQAVRDWLTVSLGLKTDKNKLYDTGLPFDDQFKDKEFRGMTYGLNYNVMFNGNWLVGVSSQWGDNTNAGGLSEVSFKNQVLISNGADTTRTIEEVVKAKPSDKYKEFKQWDMNLDVVRFFYFKSVKSTLALNPYLRSENNLTDEESQYNAGLGVYLIDPRSMNSVFGIFFHLDDAFDDTNSGLKTNERISIGLTIKKQFGLRNPVEKF
jgi:hypothetical protein